MTATTTGTTTAEGSAVPADKTRSRMMYCRVCLRWTAHVFVGVQDFGRHGRLDLWNCRCGATTSEPAH